MSDKPMTIDPNYVAPPLVLTTENERRAKSVGFQEGYHEGRDDILFGLAKGYHWARAALELKKKELADKP